MVRPPGYRRFLILVRRFEGTGAQLAALIGTSPSMFSRIQGGKVQKIGRYLERLEALLGSKPERFSDVLDDLGRWSEESPELREMLTTLHRIAQESAQL
jgi:hypothetical protein